MYFGGIEGGATHSNLVICNARGEPIAQSKGLGTNHWVLGMEKCVDRIMDMVTEAKRSAGIPDDEPLYALGLTLSGCEQESTNTELAERVKERGAAKHIYVGSDTAGSLATGAPNGGMVIIAGTGSNALLREENGDIHGCGGWGFLLGDEGAAYWIAHRAVKTAFDDIDGLRPAPHSISRVWETIQEHFGAGTRADLLPHAYKNFDKPFFAGLTLKLAQLARDGDALSQHLFSEAGGALASHAAALVRKTSMDRIRVVCVGSVWKSWDLLKNGALKTLHQRKVNKELELIFLKVTSAMGAAWLAAKHVDIDLPRDDSQYCEIFYTYRPEEHFQNGDGQFQNGGRVQNGGGYTNGSVKKSHVNGLAGCECDNLLVWV